MTNTRETIVRFGASPMTDERRLEYELHVPRLELRRYGEPVAMRRQAIEVLAFLLERKGRLVTIDELRWRLWGNQHLVWRNSLHQCIRDLRRGLGDDARQPRFVATVARVGYRFAGVMECTTPTAEARGATSTAARNRHTLAAFAAGVATAVLLPVAFFIVCAALAS